MHRLRDEEWNVPAQQPAQCVPGNHFPAERFYLQPRESATRYLRDRVPGRDGVLAEERFKA